MNSIQRRLFIEEPTDINSSTACLLLGQWGCWRWKDCTHVYSIIHSFNKMLIVAIKTLNSCLFQNFQPGSQVALWSDKRCWLLNFSGLLGEQKLPTVKTLHSCLPQNIQPLPLIGQDVDCCFQKRVKGLPTNSNTALWTEVLSINIQKGQGRYKVSLKEGQMLLTVNILDSCLHQNVQPESKICWYENILI